MGSLLSNYPFSLVDFAWVAEFAILTLSWVVLGTQKLHGGKALLRAGAEFAVLFIALNAVTLLAAYLLKSIPKNSVFPLIRVVLQGAVTLGYMLHTSIGRKQSKILLWLVMMTASMSIFAMAGKVSFLVGMNIQSGVLEGVARIAIFATLIGVAFWLRHYHFDEYQSVPSSGLVMIAADMVCVLLLNVVEILAFALENGFLIAMLVGYLTMLIMGLLAIHAMYTMMQGQQVIIDLQAEKQRFISEQEQARMTEAMLHNLRSIRHDLKNQYAYMQILLSEKRYAELETYFAELLKELPAPLQVVDCGNHTVNTVLNMEFAKMRADGIAFRHQLAVPPVLPFRSEDICAILSNLIDNAAEECRRLHENGAADANITLDIHPHQSYLFIQCSNTTDRTALERNKRGLRTTKRDAALHGYGTQIIAKLAEKYNGVSDFHLDGACFVAQVMLDMASEEKQNEN